MVQMRNSKDFLLKPKEKNFTQRSFRLAWLCLALSFGLSSCATNMQAYNDAVVKSVIDKNQNLLATGYAVISVQKADTLSLIHI